MPLNELLNWLLVPAIGGLLWVARSVSRLETLMEQSVKDRVSIWDHMNNHSQEISDVREALARIQGHLEK